MHGDLGQGAREQALRAFRSGKVDVLVATDVAARGLDIDDVTHVINYQCPEDAMTYVHRIGRTARAGKSGVSVTLIDWDDLPKWKLICDTLDLPFHQPAETYSTSEHLYLELDIPHEAKSVLPRAARTRAGLDAEQSRTWAARIASGPVGARPSRAAAGVAGAGAATGSGPGRRPANVRHWRTSQHGERRSDGERGDVPPARPARPSATGAGGGPGAVLR